MKFIIKIAEVVIEINHNYPFIKNICQDYICKEDIKSNFSVSVTEEQIEKEMELTNYIYSREVCESTCIHREVVNGLVSYGIILIHSAVIAVDNRAYVFLAKSGVGKSTHIRMWKEQFGDKVQIVNGDKPMFSFQKDTNGKEQLVVYGSPWRGKEFWGENISVPVQAFCLLERGTENRIKRASSNQIMSRLFHQVLFPKSEKEVRIFLAIMNRIVREVPFYELQCNISKEAASVAYQSMK